MTNNIFEIGGDKYYMYICTERMHTGSAYSKSLVMESAPQKKFKKVYGDRTMTYEACPIDEAKQIVRMGTYKGMKMLTLEDMLGAWVMEDIDLDIETPSYSIIFEITEGMYGFEEDEYEQECDYYESKEEEEWYAQYGAWAEEVAE